MSKSIRDKKSKSIRSKNSITRMKYLFVYGILAWPLLNFIVFYVIINFNTILLCFQRTNTATFQSEWVGLENFRQVFRDIGSEGNLLGYMWNSVKFWFFSLIFGMPLNILFGYLLVVNIKGSAFWRFCIMIPTMISGIVTAMLFGKFAENALPSLFEKMFGIKTISLLRDERYNFGTILFYMLLTGFSSNIIIYMNAMKGEGESLFEVARLEGANHLQILRYVCMPSVYPIMTTFIVTSIPGLLAGDPGLYVFYGYTAPDSVVTSGYFMFTKTKNNNSQLIDYSYAATMGVLFTLIAFPVTMAVRHLMEKFGPSVD